MTTSSPRKWFWLAALALATNTTSDARADANAPVPTNVRVTATSDSKAPKPDSIVRALEQELKQPLTAIAQNALCPARCIEVAFDTSDASKPKVFVRVIDVTGEMRERTIGLPDDRAQWLDVTTLLVGNLARDEASALIAGLTPAPPPAPIAPPIAATPSDDAQPASTPESLTADEITAAAQAKPPAPVAPPVPPLPPSPLPILPATTHRAFNVGFVPPLSLDWTRIGTISHGFSLNALVGVAGGSSVFSASGIADIQKGDVSGLQLGGIASVGRTLKGIQLSGIASIATGDSHGTQVAGITSFTAGRQRGMQISGVTSIARHDSSGQISGLVNIAGNTARGVQIGTINVAKNLTGVQIGVLNIVRKGNTGVSIGAINIVPGGRTDVDLTLDSDGTAAIFLRHGSKYFHNVYGLAANRGDDTFETDWKDDDLSMAGIGLGTSLYKGPVSMDLEGMSWHVHHGTERGHKMIRMLNQVRFSAAYRLHRHFSVVGGVIANAYVSDGEDEGGVEFGKGEYLSESHGEHIRTRIWPTAFIGVRF